MARSELRSRRGYQNVGTGEPVMCPHCGNTTRRIPRRPLDRVVNVLWDVKRFRCANVWVGRQRPDEAEAFSPPAMTHGIQTRCRPTTFSGQSPGLDQRLHRAVS